MTQEMEDTMKHYDAKVKLEVNIEKATRDWTTNLEPKIRDHLR